jgi:hypothetical protein
MVEEARKVVNSWEKMIGRAGAEGPWDVTEDPCSTRRCHLTQATDLARFQHQRTSPKARMREPVRAMEMSILSLLLYSYSDNDSTLRVYTATLTGRHQGSGRAAFKRQHLPLQFHILPKLHFLPLNFLFLSLRQLLFLNPAIPPLKLPFLLRFVLLK